MTANAIAKALAVALALASEGRSCFPCAGNKRPTSPHGFLDASADPIALCELWSKCPGQLVGVRTGNASGFDVLDLDRKHPQAAEWWTAHRDSIPVTRVHRTRSGGLHLLPQHASHLRCSASKIARGIDVRGDGGYVIWWPIAGLPALRAAPVAPWPDWSRLRLLSRQRPVASRATVPHRHALVRLEQRYRWRTVSAHAEAQRAPHPESAPTPIDRFGFGLLAGSSNQNLKNQICACGPPFPLRASISSSLSELKAATASL
jgi:hypothetical protein